jgi:hypothetical protein
MSKLKSKEALSDKDPKLSKKELAERREEITAFYKDNIPHLEVQADYEMLLAQIEKSRAERMQAQMFIAKSSATPPAPEVQPQPNVETKRTLKKVESND